MLTFKCPKCDVSQEVQEVFVGTTSHQCSECHANIQFARCEGCRVAIPVVAEWTEMTCGSCRHKTSLRAAGSAFAWPRALIGLTLFLALLYWIVPRSCYSNPQFEVAGPAAKSLRFENWHSRGFLESGWEVRVTYDGRTPVRNIQYAVLSKDGTKIDDGFASNPELSAGQAGMVRILTNKAGEAAKIVITVE